MHQDRQKEDDLDVTLKDEKTKDEDQQVAYEKKVEDKGGRDWTKRASFRPTNGV